MNLFILNDKRFTTRETIWINLLKRRKTVNIIKGSLKTGNEQIIKK